MQHIQIRAFDPQTASPELWASFHECRRALAADLHPGDPVLSDAESEIEMRRENPLHECRRWLAIAGGEVIGSARASFRKPGTPNAVEHAPFLFAGGGVRPNSGRRGAGSLLLSEIHGLMHSLGKSVLTLAAHLEPGHAFLMKAGAVAKLTTVTSRADLSDIDWPSFRQWEETAQKNGLEWERYAGRVPRERLLAFLPTFTALSADVPTGDLQIAPVHCEIEGYDRWYETLGRVGGAHHLIVLLADGEVAGVTEAEWDSRTPSMVYQRFTAVARPWRGRGLAKALKAAILRQVRDSHPEARIMETANGEMNETMRAINVQAGFRPHRRFVQYQVTRDSLDLWRASLQGTNRG
jgi:GNAT superfamily N-acetyltransferase